MAGKWFMTPARFASCLRLLKGITIQADLNRTELRKYLAKRDRLENELTNFAKLIGENRFANKVLLLSISRRLGQTKEALDQCKLDLASSYKLEVRFDRAKVLLAERIRKHELEVVEQQLMDITIASVALKGARQTAARKRY
jgi:energy-converting hydrogenase A subunit M